MSDSKIDEISEAPKTVPIKHNEGPAQIISSNANALAIVDAGGVNNPRGVLENLAVSRSDTNISSSNPDSSTSIDNPANEQVIPIEEIDKFILETEQLSFKSDFIDAMDKLLIRRNNISFGPVFSIDDRKGNKVTVYVIQMGEVISPSPPNTPKKSDHPYMLIAEDNNGDITGYKYAGINDNKDGSNMIAKGFIHTARSGSGAASCIELANQAYLGSLASIFQNDIRIEVKDRNLMDLGHRKKDYEKNPNPVFARIVERKTQEHNRWLAVYGPDGRMGLDESGHRLIRKENFLPLTDRSVISISRDESVTPSVDESSTVVIEEDILRKKVERWLDIAANYKLEVDSELKNIQDKYQKMTGLVLE